MSLIGFFRKSAPSRPPSPTSGSSGRPAHASCVIGPPIVAPLPAGAEPPFKWRPAGTNVTVAGFTIPGMIYVRSQFSPPFVRQFPGSILDFSQPVAKQGEDRDGRGMGYWPSYATIKPECRHVFLRWLAEGRCDARIGIGYVFMFFYGLEYRLLVEAPDATEREALMSEIHRLRRLYGAHGSFNGYSAGLLEAVTARAMCPNADSIRRWRPERLSTGKSWPIDLSVALAWHAVGERPVHSDVAAHGLLHAFLSRGFNTRGDAGQLLVDNFRSRIESRWPSGVVIRDVGNARLDWKYRAATSGMDVSLRWSGDLGSKWPLPEKLDWKPLIDAVDDLVTSEDSGRTVHKAAPPPVAASVLEPWLTGLGREVTPMHPKVMLRRVLGRTPPKPGSTDFTKAAERLASLGWGIVPDPGFDKIRGADLKSVYLFDAAGGARWRLDPPPGYVTAAFLAISTIARAAKGAPSGPFARAEQIVRNVPLDPAESIRLAAFVRHLGDCPPRPTDVRRLADAVREKGRWDLIYQASEAAVGAEGWMLASFEQAYQDLGLERALLYRRLHESSASKATPAMQPVIVEQAMVARPGTRIPPPLPSRTAPLLDPARVAAVRAETDEVQAFLSRVYVEDHEEASAEHAAPVGRESCPDLDHLHRELLSVLVERREWTRAAIADAARNLGLMGGAAAERINEWALDAFGDIVVIGDDPCEIDTDILASADWR